MPVTGLALFDLDNTLLDSDGAFLTWAEAVALERGLPDGAARWMCELAWGLHGPFASLAAAIHDHFALEDPVGEFEEEMIAGYISRLACPPDVLNGLDALRSDGWKVAIVTNGDDRRQKLKITNTGLDAHVDTWAVSEEVGSWKPDPLIFRTAADRCGVPLTADTWMVGDSVDHDMVGGFALGLRTIWIQHGREWTLPERPTLVVEHVREAIAAIRAGAGTAATIS